jgi:hypothetical protein
MVHMRGWALVWWGIVLLAGCTEANPDYRPPDVQPDGRPPECQVGARRCASNQITQVCSGEGRWINERLCPGLSSCHLGVCVPSGNPCRSEADCGPGRACNIFVDPQEHSRLGTFCAQTVGVKPGLSPCSAHEQCRSGFCLQRGSVSTCFHACREDTDCPKTEHTCAGVVLTVNGVKGEVKSCVN